AIATRAERGDAEFALAYRASRPAAAPSRAPREHLVRAEELADAAGQLGRRLAQRVAPGSAPAPPLSESFSDDPLLNRLYATGVQRLRRSGEAGCPYFRVCLDQDPSFLKAREMLAECLSQGSSEGAYDEAEGLWNEVVDQARKLGDRHLEAEASLDLGLLAVRRGRWAEAEGSLTAALEIFEDLGDAYYTTNALIAFSDLRSRRGGIEEAEGYLRRALEISEREQNDELTARSLHGLGVIASMRWRLDESLDLLQRALDLERSSVGLRHMEVNTLNSLGLVLPYLGRFEEAREALLEAQTLARRLGNARLEATITSSLGNVELHLDSLESAASYFAASVALFEQLENPAGAAYPSTNLAIALAKLGRHDEGRPHLELAIEHFLPDDVAVLYARGLYALADGDGAGAVELLEKAKGLSGPEGWSEEDEEILRDARRARRSP
ncbi:MAG: tetratricopeptide repeat protein, partial [Acidobacteriota bacterium]